MAIAGYRFGLELHPTRPGHFRIYEVGIYRATCVYHQTFTGSRIALAGRDVHSGRVGKVSAFDRFGGSLLWEDDHASLAGWTVAYNGGLWTASGGDAVLTGGLPSSVLVRDKGAARYFEFSDVDIDDADTGDRWIMLVVNKAGTGQTDDPTAGGPGDDGYRLLVRQYPGSQTVPRAVASLQAVNPASFYVEGRGFSIGRIALGGGVPA